MKCCRRQRLWADVGGRFLPWGVDQRRADILSLIGRWPEAEAVYGRYLSPGDSRHPSLTAACTLGTGALRYLQGDFAGALELLERAQELYGQLGDRYGVAQTQHKIGNVHTDRRELAQAMGCYTSSMELALGLGDTVLAGQAMNNIGILHGMQGDDAEAASWFRRTADIAEQAGVLRLLGKACGNLGIVAMQRSDYVAARDYLQRDIGISRTIGDRQGVADGLSNLGRLHLELGDREQARRCIAEYIAIAEQLGDRYGIAYGTDSLGQVRERCGDAAGAEACYLRAVGIYRQMQAGYDLVPALLRLTDLYAEQGRAAEVGPLLAEARALVDGRGADARQTILLRISECKLQGLTEPTAAGRALEELLGTDLDDPARARAWFELQAITGDDGHRREALRRYQALHATAPRDEYRVRIQMLGGSTRIEQ